VLVTLFLILTTISTLMALGPSSIVVHFWSQVAKTLFFLLVLAALLTERHRVHALVWMMVISLGFYGVTGGLFAIVTGGHYRVFGPPDSIIADNNQLAVALLMVLPLMNYLRLQSAHSLVRKGLAVAMLLTLVAILASYSRGALLGLAAVTLFFWWNSHHKVVMAVVLAVVLAGSLAMMPASWTERMDSIAHYKQDASAEARLTVWREAFGIALARPLTGGGYKSTATASVLHQFYPNAQQRAVHNVWLEVLSENGFPAFFVWLGMLFLGFLNTRRIRRLARGDPKLAWAEDFARMAQVTLIAFVVGGTFLSMGYYDLYLSLLVALAATWEVASRTVKAAAPESVAHSGLAISPLPIAASPAMTRTHWEERAGAVSGWRMRRLGR
ncbi:MAG: putative O-glycosylation ligase, exosortase A system-associated, partial [Acetobacteraceae bacterium]